MFFLLQPMRVVDPSCFRGIAPDLAGKLVGFGNETPISWVKWLRRPRR